MDAGTVSGDMNSDWIQEHSVDAGILIRCRIAGTLSGCIERMHLVDAGTLSGCRNIKWTQEH